MCGVVGILRFDGQQAPPELLDDMVRRLAHRGPDGAGIWTDGAVGLGHRRLAVVDVAGSPQPMASVDGRLHVTFNGEIHNYRALRSRLDYPFRTAGDTEVLLALHARHGASAVHHLEGQFAYAVHDGHDGSLRLFRDRLGILPMYWYADERMLAFASEVKALLPVMPHRPVLDDEALDSYLARRAVPAPRTMFRDVHKLPAGHHLLVGRDGSVQVSRWWALPEPVGPAISPASAVAELGATLERAVEAATIADVPVGAYLSGGVDSSLIVALMARARGGGESVRTFAAGFDDPRGDELPAARRVADLLGTEHSEVRVDAGDLTDLWPLLTWHRDGPVSEPSDLAVFRLAEHARRSVTVVLSGEGSDELFAGYPKYRAAATVAAARRLPRTVRRAAAPIERMLPASLHRARIPLRTLRAASEAEWMEAWFAPFTRPERDVLLGRTPTRDDPPAVGGDLLGRMLHEDCRTWLPDNLLERGDRMSMAASLELRPPFLDHHVVELAFRLPSGLKLRSGQTKWVVKQVARRHLPADVVTRRKIGFRVPVGAWLRGPLADYASDLLLSPNSFVGSLLDKRSIRGLLDAHASGRRMEEGRLWTLLGLEVFADVFLGTSARPPSVLPVQLSTAPRS
jgi:asparagine synthase (glutamine-hydrolysing)